MGDKVEQSNLNGPNLATMHTRDERISLDASEWPRTMKSLVQKCWDHDPDMRPTFDEIGEELAKWSAEDFGELGSDGQESGPQNSYVESSSNRGNDVEIRNLWRR
jgi:hypothetical protein